MDYDRKITQSAEETAKVGESLAYYLRTQNTELNDQKRGQAGATVVCLYGELGSGKTTFASGFAKALGITSRLLSPTFIIVRRYEIPKDQNFLYHLDLYRVSGAQDMVGLGISEILADPGSYVLIEWAEKLGDLLPKQRIDIQFSVTNDEKHRIVMNELT